MHEVPADELDEHLVDVDGTCRCCPIRVAGERHDHTIGTLLLHTELYPGEPDPGPAHEIPDDGAPHARTSECGCGPQLATRAGGPVYVHTDQAAGDER